MITPLLGFLSILTLPPRSEKIIARTAIFWIALQLFFTVTFVGYWLLNQYPTLHTQYFEFQLNPHFEFIAAIFFDKITAVYAIVAGVLMLLVTIFSQYYLHREEGYKRFFGAMLAFYAGITIIIFSGTFETLLVGWEVLGITSFLLIAYYRNRYLPIKNALKVVSLYRLSDACLIIAIWLSHHFWDKDISFYEWQNLDFVAKIWEHQYSLGVIISCLLLITAWVKSAQFPFSSWLPRAMEGPTTSTSIFYGALSVHVGLFLLLRTAPVWDSILGIKIGIVIAGLITSLLATSTARVQSTVKTQIAYASVAQIGLMFVEAGLGLYSLALVHFAGNAFLRTYQLLVSPSVLSYLIHNQVFNLQQTPSNSLQSTPSFSQKIKYAFYILSLKEWNLDAFLYKFLWTPAKKMGNALNFVSNRTLAYSFVPLYILGLWGVHNKELVPLSIIHIMPIFSAIMAVLMVLKAFVERRNPISAWTLVIMNHFWVALAIGYNDIFKDYFEIYIYLSGVVASGILGWWILQKMKKAEPTLDLSRFHGHAYEYNHKAYLFLIACLAFTGFPITPTFVGQDLLFSHVEIHQVWLVILLSISFILSALSIMRLFARVFCGIHIKTYHQDSYRNG